MKLRNGLFLLAIVLPMVASPLVHAQYVQCPQTAMAFQQAYYQSGGYLTPYQMQYFQNMCAGEMQAMLSQPPAAAGGYGNPGVAAPGVAAPGGAAPGYADQGRSTASICDGGIYDGQDVHPDRCLAGQFAGKLLDKLMQ